MMQWSRTELVKVGPLSWEISSRATDSKKRTEAVRSIDRCDSIHLRISN